MKRHVQALEEVKGLGDRGLWALGYVEHEGESGSSHRCDHPGPAESFPMRGTWRMIMEPWAVLPTGVCAQPCWASVLHRN
jgi:hypothetical protein